MIISSREVSLHSHFFWWIHLNRISWSLPGQQSGARNRSHTLNLLEHVNHNPPKNLVDDDLITYCQLNHTLVSSSYSHKTTLTADPCRQEQISCWVTPHAFSIFFIFFTVAALAKWHVHGGFSILPHVLSILNCSGENTLFIKLMSVVSETTRSGKTDVTRENSQSSTVSLC